VNPTDAIVVVGAGLAGYGVIRELRKLNGEVPLTLITADDGHFYSKPRLSNHLSSGRGLETLITTRGDEMAQKNNFTLMSQHSVSAIDSKRQILTTQKGELAYGKLVLALGASPRQPSYKTSSQKIFSINHLDDYLRMAPLLADKPTVLIYGGGLVACEFANDLASSGHKVHLVTRTTALLDRMLSTASSDKLVMALIQARVIVHLNDDIVSVDEDSAGLSVQLQQGGTLRCGLVLNAIGLVPHALAQKCGLKTDRGIVVDERLQTSIANIYALGDGAQYSEDWMPFVMPITHAAKVCAQALLNLEAKLTFPPMPVAVKTASFPLVIGTSKAQNLQHQHSSNSEGCSDEWRDEAGQLRAFALGGNRCADKAAFLKQWKP
jgi:rubredoxin---NAD+ reductase